MAPHTRVKVLEIPRNSGRWYVRVNFQKRRKTKLYGSEEKARAVAEKIKVALEHFGMKAFDMISAEKIKPVPTVKEFAERWTAELATRDLKISTRKMYESNLRVHILPELGHLLVTELDYARAKAFLLEKREATYSTGRFRKRKYKKAAPDKTYSKDSVRIMAMTIRAMMAEAVREKLVDENPAEDLAQFYRKKRVDRTVTRNQVYALDQLYLIEDQLRARTLYGEHYELFMLLSRTGMRIGEAYGLEWLDINWKSSQIRISRNVPSGTGKEEDSPKTDAGARLVDMPEELKEALQAFRARANATGLKTGKASTARVFETRYERFHESWKRAQKAAKVHYLSPHSIRHTYASQMLAAGCDIAWLANQLGHSSPAVTLAIYSHFIPGKKRQVINALDRRNANEMQIEAQGD